MAFTIDQYNAINEAIAAGVLEVEYGDKKTTYRSLTEMIAIRELIAKELGLNKNKSKTVYVQYIDK